MKKLSSIILTTLMLLSMCLAGCSNGNAASSSSAADESEASSEASKNETSASSEGETPAVESITFWHYVSDRADYIQGVADAFEGETGIHVDVQLYGGDAFGSKIQAAIQANTLPNVWMFAGGKADLGTFAKNGYVANFDAEAAYLKDFDDVAMKQVTFTPDEPFDMTSGTYGFPLDMNNMMIIFNKQMFADAGVDTDNPFTTWEEFMEACAKLSAKGYTPFTSGFGSWTQLSWTGQYQFAYNDLDTVNAMRGGEISFEQGNMTKVFQMVQDMYDSNVFMQGTATIDLPTAEAAFANNQAAMLYDGSWVINVLKGLMDNMDMDNYGVVMPPKAAGTDSYPMIAGGVGAYMVASGKQSDAELQASIQFLKFLTNKENQIAYANESSNIPANTLALDESELNPLLVQFYDGMQYLQPSAIGLKPKAMEDNYSKAVQAVAVGESTAADVVAQLDKDRAAMPPDADD